MHVFIIYDVVDEGSPKQQRFTSVSKTREKHAKLDLKPFELELYVYLSLYSYNLSYFP
jgi:hypothetical protein